MKRTILLLALASFHFAGCNGSSRGDGKPGPANSDRETGSGAPDLEKVLGDAVMETIAKPMAQALEESGLLAPI